jgi:hypothetical protein
MTLFVVSKDVITRIYKNAAGNTLRVDTINLTPTTTPLTTGVSAKTFKRELRIEYRHEDADRVVSVIELYTTADNVEDVTGNYKYAEWTTGNADQGKRCDMSDLPEVGDTV